MIDMTPLDVRNKRGDFKKLMRGYDPAEVDVFLELVAERLEALVRENLQLKERAHTLQEQVNTQAGREQAVQDALVTAQELRADMRTQSQREADHTVKEAEVEARRLVAEADAEVRTMLRDVEREGKRVQEELQESERRRARFLREFRGLLERELEVVAVEEEREPLQDRTVAPHLGVGRRGARGASPEAGSAADTAIEERASDPATPGTALADEGTSTDGLENTTVDVPHRPAQSAPPPDVGDEPSSLEVELMAEHFQGVPDLETVLAEAGSEEVTPPEGDEIAPPAIPDRPEDNLILFDADDEDRSR